MFSINLSSISPFKSDFNRFTGSDYAIIHFGTVVCSSLNSVSGNVFIPTISGQTIKRDGESGFPDSNKIGITKTGIIYLEVQLENGQKFLESGYAQFESSVFKVDSSGKEVSTMGNYISGNFTDQTIESQISLNSSSLMLRSSFLPLSNLSPPIKSVAIQYEESSFPLSGIEVLDSYNFIQDDIKRVPIAYVNSSQEPMIEQLLDIDYVFNFPYFFRSELSESFLEELPT
jgi:hypothetical protein